MTRNRRFFVLCLTVASFVLVVGRRPDALFHPQFWAEDGKVWYQEAYNDGWLTASIRPHTGYFQGISRLTAAVALLFPFRAAPLIFNLTAIAAQILPVIVLQSSRFDHLVPDRKMKLLLSFLYLALPNTREINANLTNAQWHLGLLACMVILAEPSERRAWKVFDMLALVISGLSGPFCILLLPTALLAWYRTRQRWSLTLLSIDVATSAIQGASLISSMLASRLHTSLGAGPVSFARIVGGQVFLGSILGPGRYWDLSRHAWWNPGSAVPLLITLAGMLLMAYVAWKSNWAIRLFLLFCTLTLLAALASPVVDSSGPQWPLMALPGAGGRYYFLPMLAWVVCLVWLVGSYRQHRILGMFGAAVLMAMLMIGIRKDWTYPAFVDYHFSTYAAQFDQAASGATVPIPINPGWIMVLHKR